jgi:hypothetical protein
MVMIYLGSLFTSMILFMSSVISVIKGAPMEATYLAVISVIVWQFGDIIKQELLGRA